MISKTPDPADVLRRMRDFFLGKCSDFPDEFEWLYENDPDFRKRYDEDAEIAGAVTKWNEYVQRRRIDVVLRGGKTSPPT
jgi:hypothetical protein